MNLTMQNTCAECNITHKNGIIHTLASEKCNLVALKMQFLTHLHKIVLERFENVSAVMSIVLILH